MLCFAAAECSASRVWMAAQDAGELSPWMIRASSVNLRDAKAMGDFLVSIIAVEEPDEKMVSSATFVVDVPRAGSYRLWARICCPSGGVEAFDVVAEAGGEQKVLGVWASQPAGERGWREAATAVGDGAQAGGEV